MEYVTVIWLVSLVPKCVNFSLFLTFIQQMHRVLLKLHLTNAPNHLNALYTHAEA